MTGPGGGAAMRGGRAVAMSAVVFSLAAGAHTFGGGSLPSGSVLAALGALVFLSATVLARGQLRLWTLLPVLAGLQGATHLVLGYLSPAGMTAAPLLGSMQAHAGGVHDHLAQGALTSIASTTLLAHPHVAATMSTMLIAHAAATLLTGLLLVGADGAAGRAEHWLRAVLPLISSPVVGPIATPALVRSIEGPSFFPLAPGLVRSRPRRGPPLGLTTA